MTQVEYSKTSQQPDPAARTPARLLLRAAQPQDQRAIRSLVRRARLNPLNLRWDHFLVVEDMCAGILAGVGQIRPHRDGAQELASLVVHPGYQGRGIGRALVHTLISRAAYNAARPARLYLFCRAEMEPYYVQFGFTKVDASQLPGSLAWMLRAGQFFSRLASAVRVRPVEVIAMRRANAQSSPTP